MSTAAVTGRPTASGLRRAATVLVLAAALVAGHPTAPAEAAGRPGKPKVLKVFVKGTSTLQARWSTAKGATRYQVLVATNKKMTKGRKVLRTKKRTKVVSGLRQGTTYYVKVRAYRGKRLGSWSPRKARQTLYATPGTPRLAAKGTSARSATVSWTAGRYATRYRVLLYRGSSLSRTFPWQSGRGRALTGLPLLDPGQFWSVRVQADNSGRASRLSAPVQLLLSPYAPTNLRVAATAPGGVTVTWSRAVNAQRYELLARSTVTGTQRTSATNVLGEGVGAVNGLAAGQPHELYVRSVSGAVRTAWVRAGVATPRARAYSLTVGSYNVHCANPGLRCSTTHRWSQRKAAVARMIDRYGYDVVGTQETSTDPVGAGVSQGVDLDRQLGDTYTYGAHYKGRWIYYNRRTLAEVGDGGGFSIGYSTGSRKTQYAVWQVFRHIGTGDEFAVVNAHLDSYVGYEYDKNRYGQTQSLLAQTARIPQLRGLPIIHVGDYNSHEFRTYDGPRAAFRTAGYLDGDDFAATRVRTWLNSAGGWRNPNPKAGAHTDHVYVPRSVGVASFAVDANTTDSGVWRRGAVIPSDHNPVRAVLDMPAS